MTRLFACLLCLNLSPLAMAPIAIADEAKKEAIQEDRKRIEGRWRVAELVVNGNVAKEDDAKKLVVINDADGTWQLFSDGKQISKGTSTIDPTKDPKTIDFSPTEGEAKGKQFQGIYRLDDKTRKLAFAPADKGRPNEFSSLPGSDHVLLMFERENGETRSGSATSAARRVQQNVAYVLDGHERHKLDVYAPTEGENHPVIFWIHGGGWQAGDKSSVQVKPQAFVDKGFVFVSTNYRLLPDATIKQMGEDLAKAIRWVRSHSKEYGGDPNQIFVMGHSAGAQLAALLCTDDRYLKAEGVAPTIIKGCVPVDGDTYDVPLQIATVEKRVADIYRRKFGDEDSQKDLSPVSHISDDKYIPPFLILHVAEHPETKMQSQRLAKALQDAGVSARAYPAQNKDHTSINADLGVPGDKPTEVLFDFVEQGLATNGAVSADK